MEADRQKSLPWKHAGKGDDSFSLICGGVEGGFVTLEEIEESEYGCIEGILEGGSGKKKGKSSITYSNSKKRKRGNGGVESEEDHSCLVQEGDEEEKKAQKKRKKCKKRKTKVSRNGTLIEKREGDEHAVQCTEEICKTNGGCATDEEPLLHEDEVCAWSELRLHPLLMKSIRRLGFREPTPIQKSCIPIAAHQGKDVIGAAQTGSGKTLAFGLPILQWILEEREKARSFQNHSKDVNESSGKRHLRALILAPTRELALQVSDHLKKVSRDINVVVVPIVGGMYAEKQERLLKKGPEIVVGTPGRLWELMSGGNEHLVELHSLSFFVLDEADRMIETGHFKELQSIIDMLPTINGSLNQSLEANKTHITIPNFQRKKRQTFVFSATIALSENFRKKLKRTPSTKSAMIDGLTSIEKLSERAGMRPDVAIIDLTHASIVADKLVESFIKCGEEDKDAYLYYILSVHRAGRTIVFCTSIAALRRISSLLRLLDVSAWTLHAQMQQRARLKAMDRFRDNENGVLIATDVAARGLDIPGIRTVVHYQLPHSAEVYIHRSGRTARASADGCSIALISPSDQAKFFSLCKSLSKERIHEFYVDNAYMTDLMRRLSLARQIDKVLHKNSQEHVKKNWFERNALSVEVALDDTESEEERVTNFKQKKVRSFHLKKLQQELNALLSSPLQPKAFSRQFFAGSGVSPLLQKQLEELSKAKTEGKMSSQEKKNRS
ncbi:hypothetical protein HPP92_004678 [Vanilla planifolia]|uniref:DEAD-box ATP-dependent RNA helicase 13 n=1 Tax=Vanilla planifolia TaxID=51239 RepID=A0A835RLF2_VANPL|nr:hypothetical protein HPP92_004678 [Vanilla planifolia]